MTTARAQEAASVGRRIAIGVLVTLAALLSVLALAVGYVRRAAVDSDQFANRATVALADDSVRSLIATRVTDGLVLKKAPDLLAARPLIQSIVGDVVGGRAFRGAFRAAVRDVHRAVFNRDQHTVTLAVADVGTMVAAGLEVVQPSLADRIDVTRRVEVVRSDVGDVGAEAARVADDVKLLAPLLLLAAVACAAAAIWLSRDRRRTVVHLCIALAIAAFLVIVALDIGRDAVVDRLDDSDERDAARAVWDAFLGDLHTAAWIVAVAAAVIAASAASLIRPVEIGAPLRAAATWIGREPARPAYRVLRGVALVAAGLALLLARDAVITLLFDAAGLYLIFAGVNTTLWLVYQPREDRPARRTVPARSRRRVAVPAFAALLVVVAIAAFLGTGGATTAAPAAGPCNGHEALCDRPLPQVALAATHNAMSVPLPGWFASEQDAPIADQLDFGIRGLLIDTHYADRLDNGRLRTVLGSRSKLKEQLRADGVSPSAVDSALRTRERLGFSGAGERGMYLCHTFCELGGTLLSDVLDDLHNFLVANPGEVVVVINQDYVTPKDFVGAVRDAGLEELAYRGPVSGSWRTLGEMVRSGQRVLFLAENRAGTAPWYHPAYKTITEETPYTYKNPALLLDQANLAKSCKPNRGPDDAPLFLVNHWISTDPTPLPSHADQVNAYAPLMRRLRECRRIRHHIPNLVAVNFYRRGDVLRAVDTLNGFGSKGG